VGNPVGGTFEKKPQCWGERRKMPLYHIQDVDRPMWVIASGYGHAVSKWKTLVAKENEIKESEVEDPETVDFICYDDEIIRSL
jgi:hypothetical protein